MSRRDAGGCGRRGTSCERGSSAVEAAIVTPVVVALLFGIVEMGFLFKDYLAAAGAVRSGVRIASATPRNATFSQVAADRVASTGGALDLTDVKELWVYKAGAGTDKPVGFSDFSGCTACVKFRWDAASKQFVKLPGWDWLASDQNACSSSSLAGPPDRVGVFLKIEHKALTGLVFNTIYISEDSIMTLEPMTFTAGCKP